MALYVRPAAATCRSSGSGAQEPSRGLPSDPREMGSWAEIWVPPYSDSGGVVFLLLVSILKIGIQIEFLLELLKTLPFCLCALNFCTCIQSTYDVFIG